MPAALQRFSRTADLQIVFPYDSFAPLTSRRVRGRMTAGAALRAMVAGLPVRITVLTDHVAALAAAPLPSRRPPTAGTGDIVAPVRHRREAPDAATVGGDKAFDVASFVESVRTLGVTPHVAQKDKYTAIDARTTRHGGYAISQQKRKLIEQVFGWMKTIGGLRKLRHRGGELVDWIVTFTAAAYNLIRLRTLLARPA